MIKRHLELLVVFPAISIPLFFASRYLVFIWLVLLMPAFILFHVALLLGLANHGIDSNLVVLKDHLERLEYLAELREKETVADRQRKDDQKEAS